MYDILYFRKDGAYMQENNLMSKVLDIIDEIVKTGAKDKEIKLQLYKRTGYPINQIGNFFEMQFNESIGHYILERRMWYAYKQVIGTDYTLLRIAVDFGYERNETFTHAFKGIFGMTPSKVRKEKTAIPDNRKKLITIEAKPEAEKEKIEMPMNNRYLTEADEVMNYATSTYGVSPDTVFAVAEAASHFGIPVIRLLDACIDVVADVHNNPDYIPPEIEQAIDIGITSASEMDEICEYYGCSVYDLNEYMVDMYRQRDD